ncbi:MAG: IgGFc-binding protein [Polyangiaceae bacterium]|nr:IgGFc-binding protein [Polyangiaceae bacterium]MCW5790523.1 IgGFc-binding protein [Polyangiaceae bacterium]
MKLWAPLFFLSCLSLSLACSTTGEGERVKGSGGSSNGGNGNGGSGGGVCIPCIENVYQPCTGSGEPRDCGAENLTCIAELGCVACDPIENTCVGNEVHACNADGSVGSLIETCDAGQGLLCNKGRCTTECEKEADSPSNVGCEFWAVDLPNERVRTILPLSAAESPWGVVLANAGITPAHVTVERNVAPVGQPLQLQVVHTGVIPVDGIEPIGLPTAEISGPIVSDPPGPPGSQLTSLAFRITTTAPVVAYQFNTFTNTYTNDASLLLPRSGLGTLHRILGYVPAKPVAVPGFNIPGIPERSFVTVIGVEPNTRVRIKAGGRINTDTVHIPRMETGDEFEITIGPFDVLNLGSEGMPGDLTGTWVESSKPVSVFSSTETASIRRPNMPSDAGSCCTDHLEEQIFPVTALGREFVITRSPPRGTSDVEEDLVRFLGVAETTEITTNLPGGDAQFTLAPGELREVWTKVDFVATATKPVMIGQLLVSQETTEQGRGDPSLTIFPPTEQYRRDYAFLIPPTWPSNDLVVSTTESNVLTMDGQPLTGCTTAPAGTVAGITYVAKRCPVSEGRHRVSGTEPFGITVYGYSGPASFAFAGGADVKPVYEPPPVF